MYQILEGAIQLLLVDKITQNYREKQTTYGHTINELYKQTNFLTSFISCIQKYVYFLNFLRFRVTLIY